MSKQRAYTIAEDGKSITCHTCGKTSYNQNDVANTYCGNCKCLFEVGLDPRRQTVDDMAEAIQPMLGERRYILLLYERGENASGASGYHVNVCTNFTADEARRAIAHFHQHITPGKETK